MDNGIARTAVAATKLPAGCMVNPGSEAGSLSHGKRLRRRCVSKGCCLIVSETLWGGVGKLPTGLLASLESHEPPRRHSSHPSALLGLQYMKFKGVSRCQVTDRSLSIVRNSQLVKKTPAATLDIWLISVFLVRMGGSRDFLGPIVHVAATGRICALSARGTLRS